MHRLVLKSTLLALVIGVLGLSGTGTSRLAVYGQDLSVGVTPSFIDFELDAGETVAREFTLSNEGDVAFSVSGQVGALPGAESSRSAAGWLVLEPGPIQLDPGSSELITVIVAPPASVAVGGYYAQITFSTNPMDEDGSPISVIGELSVPFLLAVDGPGDFTYQADVDQFSAVLEPDGRIGFRTQVTNTGNRHIFAKAEVELFEEDETLVGDVAFPDGALILPGQTVVLAGDRSLLLEAGETYTVVGEVDAGPGDPVTVEFEFTADAPSLEVSNLRVCRTDIGTPTLEFNLVNDQGLAVLPTVAVSLLADDRQVLSSVTNLEVEIAWTGSSVPYSFGLPQALPDGSYSLILEAGAGADSITNRNIRFRIESADPQTIPAC